MRIIISVICLLLLHCGCLQAQDYEVGESYFSANNYIEYLHGNLPIILSAPHGGYQEPDEIPDRDCDGCIYERDAYTQELTKEIADYIFLETGCYPYVIINKLHRIKMDANRSIETGADGDTIAEQAWMDFQNYIQFAEAKIEEVGAGLFLDMHGHGHEIERLELGYLLTDAELQLDAVDLNQENYVSESSIAELVRTNKMNLELSELLTGDFSFGTLIEEQSYDAVPSFMDPFPGGTDYFTGGYNTVQHGSKLGGKVDAVQVECNQDVRFDEAIRQNFAEAMAKTILQYMDHHYEDFDLCQMTATTAVQKPKYQLFPIPCHEEINLNTDQKAIVFEIYNTMGVKMHSGLSQSKITTIDLTEYPAGSYFLLIKNDQGVTTRLPYIKI